MTHTQKWVTFFEICKKVKKNFFPQKKFLKKIYLDDPPLSSVLDQKPSNLKSCHILSILPTFNKNKLNVL